MMLMPRLATPFLTLLSYTTTTPPAQHHDSTAQRIHAWSCLFYIKYS